MRVSPADLLIALQDRNQKCLCECTVWQNLSLLHVMLRCNYVFQWCCFVSPNQGGKGYQYSRTRRWRKFQKGKIYNAEEHVAIESFVTTLIHWTFFLMTRTKLAFVGFVAAGNSMWHQVLDDLCLVVTDQSATTCDSSFAPNSTQYNSVLQSTTPEGTTPVLQSTNPFLLRTTKYYKVLLRTTKY